MGLWLFGPYSNTALKTKREMAKKFSFLVKLCVIWGIFWGALSVVLFFVGLAGFYRQTVVLAIGIIATLVAIGLLSKLNFEKDIAVFFQRLAKELKKDRVLLVLTAIFGLFVLGNFLLLLAPEVGFDALWYHLTIPKIYLETGQVGFLGRDLFYYSMMPRLAEMVYGFGLAITPLGFIPRLLHYLFGLFWFLATYAFLRLFLNRRISFLAALVTYSSSLVTHLSGTAYIDLITSFYAVMSFYGLFSYLKTRDEVKLTFAAIFMGFCLATKLYALFLFGTLILVLIFTVKFRSLLRFAAISLIITLPFYLQAYFLTGNPIYPILSVPDSGLLMYLQGNANFKEWILNSWWKSLPYLLKKVLIFDFTPIFILILLVPWLVKFRKILIPTVTLGIFFIFWSLLPTHEPRYFLVVLPLLALIFGYLFENLKSTWYFYLVVFGIIVNLVMNLKSQSQPLKVAFGMESATTYLQKSLPVELNYLPTNKSVSRVVGSSKVMTANIHNLFYINFPFVDWSMIEGQLGQKNPAEIFQALKDRQIKYLLVGDTPTPPWNNFPPSILTDQAELLLDQDSIMLYRLK